MKNWTTEQVANYVKDKDEKIELLERENNAFKSAQQAKEQEQEKEKQEAAKPKETITDIMRSANIRFNK